jgi:hypothetical protein
VGTNAKGVVGGLRLEGCARGAHDVREPGGSGNVGGPGVMWAVLFGSVGAMMCVDRADVNRAVRAHYRR